MRLNFLCMVAVITPLIALALSGGAGAQTVAAPRAEVFAETVVNGDARRLETGLPLLRSFSPKEYGAQPQNWAIVQDRRGVIYVGNEEGVLEFDGRRWRLIRVTNNTLVRSLAMDTQGRIYVGAVGEIGTLEPDASGQMRYVSLLDRVPPEARRFADVWNIFVTSQGVVFSSFKRVMRLQGDQFESWIPANAFHFAFQVADRVFVREPGRGLLELLDGQLRLLPGGERFADERIYAMLSGPATTAPPSILIGTRTQGFFILGPNGLKAWPSDIDAKLKRDLLYCAARLPDGRLALGTLQGGLYLIDERGRNLGHLGKADGLPDDFITSLSADREGGLWIATGNGLARAEIGSPLSRFDERSGLAGTTVAVHRHQGQISVGTTQGLFRLKPGVTARFNRIALGNDPATWAFLSVGQELLVGSAMGVYTLNGERAALIKAFNAARSLHASQAQPGRVFVGGRAGLAVLRRVAGNWQDEGPVTGVEDEIRSLQEDRNGGLWLGTFSTGVIRVHLPASSAENPIVPLKVERFGVGDGLPSLNGNRVYQIGDELLFATQAGVFRFSEATLRFEPDPRFGGLFAQKRAVQRIDEAEQGFWMSARDPNGIWKATGLVRRQVDGGYRWDATPLSALAGIHIEAIHHDPNGVVWFGDPEGLFRYDPHIAKTYNRPFSALLRHVHGREDRPIFTGQGVAPVTRLAYDDNALRFEFAAPSFDGLDALRFQVRLDGSDSEWSDWSAESYKDYNNLFEGDYRFRVRGMNLYGTVSSEAVYAFTVLPPWYRTVWAYLGYLLALIGSGWAASQWRVRHLQTLRQRLQRRVAESTADILKLGEIGKELTATLDVEQAFDRMYRQIESRLDAFTFWIGIYRPERSSIQIDFLIEGGERLAAFEIALTEANLPVVWCLRERRELIAATRAELLDYAQVPLPAKAGSASESVVYLPLIVEDRVIGCLSVQSPQQNAYTLEQLEFLRVLSSYAAIALDKASAHQALAQRGEELERSLAEVEQMNRQVSMLGELTGFLQACGTAEEAFTCIAEFGPRLFFGSHAVLYLHDGATDAWIRHGGWGTFAHVEAERFVDADCWALRRGRAYRFDSLSDSRRCPHLSCGDAQRPIYVCLPLTTQGKIFGLLNIQHVDLLEGNADERRYRLAVALAEHLALAIANVQLREALMERSIRDPLTGLHNRRYLHEAMPRELSRGKREGTPFALLMIDVDHFKRCNDRFGHPAGDSVLKHVARMLEQALRAGYLACRFGGEEFAVLLPGCERKDATLVADRILEGIRGLVLSHEGRALDRVTVSIGMALFPQHGEDPESLIEAADRALYAAKQAGRDRLMISGQG